MGNLNPHGFRTARRVREDPLQEGPTRGPLRARELHEDRLQVGQTRGPFRARELLSQVRPHAMAGRMEKTGLHLRLSSEQRPEKSHLDCLMRLEPLLTLPGRLGRGRIPMGNHRPAMRQQRLYKQ